jgi:HSP20 family protein
MHWDPFHDLLAFGQRTSQRPQRDAAWTPTVDLLETDAAFLIFVELSGLGPHDFAINTVGNELQLTGERPPVDPPPQRYLRMERGHGRFARTFTFGDPVKMSAVEAAFDRGLLRITVPKSNEGDRRIAIE